MFDPKNPHMDKVKFETVPNFPEQSQIFSFNSIRNRHLNYTYINLYVDAFTKIHNNCLPFKLSTNRTRVVY